MERRSRGPQGPREMHKVTCSACGKETEVLRSSLVLGLTTSCGCFAIEKFVAFTKNNTGEKHHNYNHTCKHIYYTFFLHFVYNAKTHV